MLSLLHVSDIHTQVLKTKKQVVCFQKNKNNLSVSSLPDLLMYQGVVVSL